MSALPTSTSSLRQENQMSFTENANDEYVLKRHLGEFPYQAPSGYKWVSNGWKLVEINATQKPWIKSFEEAVLDKIKGLLGKNKGEVKRCRLDCCSKLVSQKEFLERLQIKEAESKTSKNNICKKPNKKGCLQLLKKEIHQNQKLKMNLSNHLKRKMKIVMKVLKKEKSDKSIEKRKKTWNTLRWHQTSSIIFVFCVGLIVSSRFRRERNWTIVRYNLWWQFHICL